VQGTTTVNELARFPGYLPEIPKFFLTGKGALTFGVTTAQVFADSREGLASPDLQLLFTPGSTNTLKFGQLDDKPAMSCVVCVVKPDSRGTVMATSADPSLCRTTSMWSPKPASASSTELSMISHRQCMSPRPSLDPMYMPGRLRTASSPSRTRRCAAV